MHPDGQLLSQKDSDDFANLDVLQSRACSVIFDLFSFCVLLGA